MSIYGKGSRKYYFANVYELLLKTSGKKCDKCLQVKFYISNKVENIVTNGENAHNEQFLLLSLYLFTISHRLQRHHKAAVC